MIPPPDLTEIAEHLASHVLLEIERGAYTCDDLRDKPEIGCIEQVAFELRKEGREVPTSIDAVLSKAKEAGRLGTSFHTPSSGASNQPDPTPGEVPLSPFVAYEDL
jgi:hypothetical protein